MAKESMKAREVKRAKLNAKYAAKRKALLEAGDYEALQKGDFQEVQVRELVIDTKRPWVFPLADASEENLKVFKGLTWPSTFKADGVPSVTAQSRFILRPRTRAAERRAS